MRAAAAAGRGDGGKKAAMGLSRRRSRRRDGRLSIVAMGSDAGCWLEASMTEVVGGVEVALSAFFRASPRSVNPEAAALAWLTCVVVK